MATDHDISAAFETLHSFDHNDLEPPAWANGPQFQWGDRKNGESSNASHTVKDDGGDCINLAGDQDHDEDEDLFEDASEGLDDVEELDDTVTFTTSELKRLLEKALMHKSTGNTAFSSKPPMMDKAVDDYTAALKCLPDVVKQTTLTQPTPRLPAVGGIEEITEVEAVHIQLEADKTAGANGDVAAEERLQVEDDIRGCAKACWGNLGACYTALQDDKETVSACNKALQIDPLYAKALTRRAAANERLATWSSLTAAQEDYTTLIKITSSTSPIAATARAALRTLPERIRSQQNKEKDEMLGKLKELGNSILGNFGMSTDMFKFDQQEGGGYNMRFER